MVCAALLVCSVESTRCPVSAAVTAVEMEKPILRSILNAVADDIQGGTSLSKALAKHPDAFSDFYVNMVRSGEA